MKTFHNPIFANSSVRVSVGPVSLASPGERPVPSGLRSHVTRTVTGVPKGLSRPVVAQK